MAKRDSAWMGKVFNYLGNSTGCITNDLEDSERKNNYGCDVTYATNNELGFDYLRDNMKYEFNEMVQRGHNYCIVDEVDSILIDESRTPLVISGKIEDKTTLYLTSNEIINKLQQNDYELDEKNKNVILTDSGVDKVEKLSIQRKILKNNNFYDPANLDLVHHTNQALKANLVFKKDIDYIVNNGKVQIIDEFTGRVLEGRRFSDGLHQAIEAKENVDISENQLRSITYKIFQTLQKLNMTGTIGRKFMILQQMGNSANHMEMIRKDLTSNFRKREKVQQYKKNSEFFKGQPVLVGTTSIENQKKFQNF